jgi:hypothetical protein
LDVTRHGFRNVMKCTRKLPVRVFVCYSRCLLVFWQKCRKLRPKSLEFDKVGFDRFELFYRVIEAAHKAGLSGVEGTVATQRGFSFCGMDF